jgi:hypothetical protein
LRGVASLCAHGARWLPSRAEVAEVRAAMLKAVPERVAGMIELLAKCGACERLTLLELLRTKAIREHLAKEEQRLQRLVISVG